MADVFWFFGLSGSGKSTLADKFAEDNKNRFFKIERIDGDTERDFWHNDLGYTRKDRIRNIARAAAKANVMSLRGVTVVASFTTPFKVMREHLRTVLGEKLQLIFVDTPLETCIERDPKGLYKKALAGEIKNMIGVDMKFLKNKQKYTLFIGRFDPFHKGHKYIVDSFINNWKPVCIAVRDCESDTPIEDRIFAIKCVFANNPLVRVMYIPDIDMVAVGRGVGYSIVEVPEDIKTISATKIRNGEIENDVH